MVPQARGNSAQARRWGCHGSQAYSGTLLLMSSSPEHKRRSRQGSEQRKRQVSLTARVNPDEERAIRQAADRRGISVATLIRTAALAEASR